jgi:DNA-nicking Smr family endonuclease
MTKPRRYRSLSSEERRLWAHVARGVTPMRGRAFPPEPDPEPAAPVPAPVPPPSPPRPGPSHRVPPGPPLAPVERKTLLALRRGSRAVDGVMDLHGLRQDEAHAALIGFLRRSQAAGHGLVLVITGKGAAGTGGSLFEERGVLRRVVPHWLRLPDLRSLVLGFDEASPHHGGSGALYVRLRRRRGGGQDR